MPSDYLNFDLLIEHGPSSVDYRARVIRSPAGEASADFTLPFTEGELSDFLGSTVGRTRHYGVESKEIGASLDPRAFGIRLYDAAFAGSVGLCLRRSLDKADQSNSGLRIRLRLDPAVLDLAELPWEFLFATDLERFLALSDLTPIVRYIEQDRPVKPLLAELPLTVLAVFSNPTDVTALAVEQEWQNLQDALKSVVERGVIVLERLESATLAALQARLRRGPVDLLHFVGHGFFDPKSDTGGLVFENENGRSESATAETLGMLLHDHHALRLIFLNACDGAQGGRHSAFAGVAQRLVQQRVPAVLAMQFAVTDAAAIALSQVFYQALADGLPADTALSQARKAIAARGNASEWGTPVLFSRSDDNRLIEYVQKDRRQGAIVAPPPALPPPPDIVGFVGREQELAHFTSGLASDHIAVIAGMAGIGKTALAIKLARQVARSPDRIFWHQFHEGEGIETIIWRLAGMLYKHDHRELWELLEGTRQSGGQPPQAEVLLDYLTQFLRGQDYVLCLDDFHHTEEDPLVGKTVTRLQTLLAAGEVTLIVTSRRMPAALRTLSFAPLGGLNLADAAGLLTVRRVGLTPALLAELHRQTDGNPELLTLASYALRHNRQPELVIKRLADEDDVETFLLKKVDEGLTGDEKQTINGVAALLGYPGTRDAIEATLASGSLKRTLRYLANRFLLREQDGQLGQEYLTHAIIQAFYYEMMSRGERQEMHRRAGNFYEHEEPDLLRAAMHYYRAAENNRAAELAATDIWAFVNQGQAHPLRALLKTLEQTSLDPETRLSVLVALGDLLAFLDAGELAQARYQQALDQLGLSGSDLATSDWEARACLGMGTALVHQAPEEALRWLEQGLAAAGDEDKDLQAALHNRIGNVRVGLVEYDAAIASLQQALYLLPDAPSQLRANVLINLGTAYAWSGDVSQGSWYTTQALEISRQLHDLYGVLGIISNIGIDKEIGGNWAGAGADYQEALEMAEHLGSLSEQARIHGLLGTLRLHQGDDAAAEEHLLRAVDLFRQIKNPEYLAATLPVLAQLYIGRQEWASARAALSEAEALATARSWGYILPETYTAQAQLALAEDDLAGAQERAELAVAIASELGQAVDEGKAWRAKGVTLTATGQMDEALAAFERSLLLLAEQDPFETARTQLAFACGLATSGNVSRASQIHDEAEKTLLNLGATVDF